ncbi:hypothetical protein [Jiangella endophytica]|uniref:hypothetical protein n=1 Tax=Jiangella endophytica TaxID=1623398 RepID=UPI000E344A07|nr:hypothetical protein [Jiangella endophytica]
MRRTLPWAAGALGAVLLWGEADRIMIVSHPLHAEKGRACLHRADPEPARRLRRIDRAER